MIENQTSIARYTGNGTITEFSIPFSFYKNADGAPETYQVAVYQRDKGQAEKKLDQGTDYSVTWEEATLSGKIVLATALPNESVLAIIREVPPSQEVEYKANEPFPYDGTNTALDKLTMLVQEHEEALSRKLGVTPTYDKTAEETMADVINAKESAEASAAAAKASAGEAKGYAQEAESAKVGAVEAKDLAVEAADNAELYAQNAENSKQGADAALSQLNDQVALAQAEATEANAAKQSAQTSADQASSSAQEAKTSEDTAVQQATDAINAQKEATRASISCAINEQRTLSYYNEVKRLADVFNAEPATNTTYGFTRYATEAEAEAGELNNVSSTPAQVKKAADKAAADSKAYADTKLTEGKAYTDTKFAEGKEYTDTEISGAKQYADNAVSSHAGNTSNPHKVTKAQVGLGLVDNTADADKPVSGPQQTAINLKADKTYVDEELATKADLVDGKVPAEQLPLSSGGGKRLGEIFFSPSKNATDNPGGLPLWTGEYYSNGSSLYPDFYAWVKSHTELCKTKTEYDSAISTYGECPYYVVDEVEGSLRLPKLVNYLKMANATDGVTQAQAGLPNITGTFSEGGNAGDTATGAFYVANPIGTSNQGLASDGKLVGFDASRSSAIYGESDTVTPAHTTVFPWVYAFNSAVSASEAQAAEFTGALSGKLNTDLSNASRATQAAINSMMPANMDYVVDSYSDANGNWWRKYKSGWLEQGGKVYVAQDTSAQVSLLKAFSNGNYFVTSTYIYAALPRNAEISIANRTTTKFTMYCYCIAGDKLWYACGQGA